MKNTVLQARAQDALQSLPPDSIHLTVTSPPYYNAREYSQYRSYEDYLDQMQAIFQEVHRITQEGRFLALNSSPVIEPREKRSTQSQRFAVPFDLHHRLTRSGWDFLEDIVWIKPEGSAKNRIAGFAQHRKPLAWKPNIITEYVMVYRKQTDKLIDWNLRQYSDEKTQASLVPEGYETSNVWRIRPAWDPAHPAVYPEALCTRLIRYYSYTDDVILDPFAGTGTTGIAARRADRDFLLIEQHTRYIQRIRERFRQLENESRQMDLGFMPAKKPRSEIRFRTP